jgi:predicted DNA-binding ribbon-helix-helix protein
MSRIVSRGIVINGHPTSFRLEPVFWKFLRVIAVECGCSVRALIEGIFMAKSPKQSLSSAIRVYTAAYFYGASTHCVMADPTSRLSIRVVPEGNLNRDRAYRQAKRSLRELDLDRGTQQRDTSDSGRPPRPRAA